MKKILLLTITLLAVFALVNFGLSFAEDAASNSSGQAVLDAATLQAKIDSNSRHSSLAQAAVDSSLEMPEWVRRTNFAVTAGTEQKPVYFMESVQPIFGTQNDDVVFFNQMRLSQVSDRPLYNIGLGARRVFNDKYLLGTNIFYDYQEMHKHSRGGVGFEAINDYGVEARVNTYIRISNERLVKEDAFNKYYEKVANGFDWELGAPIPYVPSVKVYGGGNWYDYEHFKNKYGWKLRTEFTPAKYSRIGFIVADDTKTSKTSYGFEGAVTLAFTSFAPRDIIKDMKSVNGAYPKVNLHDKTLDRVVRDNNIIVIESVKSKTSGLTIEGGRK